MIYTISLERRKLLLAFGAVYTIWGSTYLAVHVALEALPPFVLGGVRFTLAGLALLAYAWARGVRRLERGQWRSVLIGSALMLVVGHGVMLYASQAVPSGLVALLGASLPLWTTLLDSVRPGGERPGALALVGLALASAGMVLLVSGSGEEVSTAAVPPLEAALVVFGTLGWAVGSLYASRAPSPGDGVQTTGLQMLVAGVAFSVMAAARGEASEIAWGAFSPSVLAAVGFLTIFGSLVAFSAYTWLAPRVSPALLATHAYVNPLVALSLGVLIGGEVLTGRVVLASGLVLTAVVLLTLPRSVVGKLPWPPFIRGRAL